MGNMTLEQIKEELRRQVPDFAKEIQPIYELLGWEWQEAGVPTVRGIEETLCILISDLKEGFTAAGTGGLRVFYKEPSEDDAGEFGLCFELKVSQFYGD